MSRPSSDIREVLANQAPIIGSMFGAVGNRDENYIADLVLPPVSGAEGAADIGNLLRYRSDALFGDVDADDSFGIGSDPHQHGGAAHELVPYSSQGRGLIHYWDTRMMQGLPQMPEAAQLATIEAQYRPTYQTMKILRERRASALYLNSAWTTAGAAGAVWSLPGTDIIADIAGLVEAVEANSGMAPNAFISSRRVRNQMRRAPQLLNFLPNDIDRNFQNTDSVKVALKSYFDFDIVEFGLARANTVTTGATTLVDLWGTWVWVGYIPAANGKATTVGTMTGPASAQVTPTATALIRTKEWEFTYGEDSHNPYSVSYLGDYMEDMVMAEPRLGALLTGVL